MDHIGGLGLTFGSDVSFSPVSILLSITIVLVGRAIMVYGISASLNFGKKFFRQAGKTSSCGQDSEVPVAALSAVCISSHSLVSYQLCS